MKPSTSMRYNESGLNTDIGFEESSLKRQHPHRAGRIRIDRQFTTAITISCDSNSDGEEPGRKRKLTETVPNKSFDEKTDSECHLFLRNTCTGNKNKKIECLAREDADSISTDGDDSAEDDDILLFVPFKGP